MINILGSICILSVMPLDTPSFSMRIVMFSVSRQLSIVISLKSALIQQTSSLTVPLQIKQNLKSLSTSWLRCSLCTVRNPSRIPFHCPSDCSVEPVQIYSEHNHCSRLCPNVTPRSMTAEVSYINACTGLDNLPNELATLLERMCIFATPSSENKNLLDIKVPIVRSDILHQCDLMEDVAIAHGYNNLPRPPFLRSATVGAPLPMNKLSDIVRKEVALAGWTEVMSLILCSHDENYKFLRRKDDKTAVVLANPKTFEYQVVRTTLLPGILKTLRENKAMGLPIGIFEVSDVVLQDESLERKARNERRWAGIWINKTAGFEIVHGLLDRYEYF
jgi:phenylalanyl-tRNA synthetase beta chain